MLDCLLIIRSPKLLAAEAVTCMGEEMGTVQHGYIM
jgi:hypothetical protein